MADNYTLITKGFHLLTEILAPYVAQQLRAFFGNNWWQDGVLAVLYDEQKRDLPDDGDWGMLVDSLDAARCLVLIDIHWNQIFKLKLSKEHRHWVKELITTRNKWAHKGSGDFSADDAWRALDTMARLTEQLDAETTEALRALVRQVRYGTTGASTAAAGLASPPAASRHSLEVLRTVPRGGLKPWRNVIRPHPDVAEGRYRQAEFAADLSQVVRGTAQIEYQDPVEFFARTYITEGMKDLLVQAIRRTGGAGGEPVIQLKTAFGGGKTHSMLALYHLLRSATTVARLPNLQPVLAAAGAAEVPRARIAVLVGTALNPSKARRPANLPGITINTLWGEMAAQLAEQVAEGDAATANKIYDIVRDADKKAVPPGSAALVELLDTCGPCLILIDELVAYARKIYKVDGLPAGSFEAVLTFVQELTEAARASQNSLVVASIPESEIEIGGEAGKITQEQIEHTFGRMEYIWKPVGADEGFEIVRRRLFLDVEDEVARDEVCRAFSEMYSGGGRDFPLETKELAYLARLKACYPIHPEVFDRLYNDWAALDRFQRTRGVLRLMAAVIHELWLNQDAGLMIMPGSIPLNSAIVREELTRYLDNGWNNVVETDVDGPRSLPQKLEKENPRFGQCMAARRVARSIFLGSAPSVREQRNRGIEDVRVRLGVVQPGEAVAVFNDAAGHLLSRSTHLYVSGQRFWYDLPPNLRRTVEDRAQQYKSDDVELELEKRLKAMRDRGEFAGVHVCPASSADVPDEQAVRLVVLSPQQHHRLGSADSPALAAAGDILASRGAGPRLYRNMLAFVAPDRELIASLDMEVRRYLAWQSVLDEAEALNLDAHQRREAAESKKRADETVDIRLKEAYSWLLTPYQEGAGPVMWETVRIGGSADSPVVKASQQMRTSEYLITRWSPALLFMELERWLWRDQEYIQIKKVWEYLASYCYLPRLKDVNVLIHAIAEGLRSDEYFGYAAAVTEAGRFLGLSLGPQGSAGFPEISGFLVKPAAAKRQFAQDEAEASRMAPPVDYPPQQDGAAGTAGVRDGRDVPPVTPPPSPAKKVRRFFATVDLDTARIGRDAGKIAEEVIQHLALLNGARVRVSLDIQADFSEGVPDNVVRTVTENCRTLRFKHHEFEE
ncbi:conserved hypothetical protein [Thermosinus carboxydivorans Nor1]|uniref:Swt1-like HEPN domain-containing protein n=1 Tax=Thermosinus carboxydivorans Nor1 TaxID=401526 RepID=A1HMM8_9FIRM|nr:Swt1 family HEPN domain-containing protein [Thermosinus carboxydivorans]EAX48518.1 conserved hypothetical protein [Thermosinus carboxydivorans Nor1]